MPEHCPGGRPLLLAAVSEEQLVGSGDSVILVYVVHQQHSCIKNKIKMETITLPVLAENVGVSTVSIVAPPPPPTHTHTLNPTFLFSI